MEDNRFEMTVRDQDKSNFKNVNLIMDILIKNVQEKHLPLINELAKTLDFEVSEPIKESDYNPDFVAKIKQGDEDIIADRTTKITLDDIWK